MGNTTIQPASRPITTALGPLLLGLMSQAHCTFTVSGLHPQNSTAEHSDTIYTICFSPCSTWEEFYIKTQKSTLSFSSLLLKTCCWHHVYKTQGTEVMRLLGISSWCTCCSVPTVPWPFPSVLPAWGHCHGVREGESSPAPQHCFPLSNGSCVGSSLCGRDSCSHTSPVQTMFQKNPKPQHSWVYMMGSCFLTQLLPSSQIMG